MKRLFSWRARQRGMASTLLMLLTGAAVTVTAVGMMHGIRGAQEQQMASHATTPSESLAWGGVELVRLYLLSLSATELAALQANQSIATTVSGLAVTVVDPYAAGTGLISLNVTATTGGSGRAAASVTVQAVYAVVTSSSGSGDANNGNTLPSGTAVNVGKPLNLSGSITFSGVSNARLAVKGDASLSGSVTGLKYLQATGNIVINGGSQVDEVFANGTLTLNGSASVVKGSALGNITAASGGSQGALYSNGDLTISNGSVGTGSVLGKIVSSSGGTMGTLTAGKTIAISNGTTTTANAVGDLTISSWPTVRNINSQATVTCPSQYWTQYTAIRAKSVSGCPTSGVTAPTTVSVTLIDPLVAKVDTQLHVDAYDYKTSANYVFEYVSGKKQVTVQNVNGLTDGVYYLGNLPQANGRGYQDFLCKSVDTSNNCTSPAAISSTTRTLCQGQSTYNTCFSYGSGKWTVSGKSLAPGVLWFKGDVEMSNGEYYNTVIATGNITTSGSHKLYALNYAGYSVVCNNTYLHNGTTDFAGMYPTAFCDTAGAKLKSNALGNIAYLDGSFDNSVFSGGSITLGASSEVFGSIVAGDVFLTGGSSTVHGAVVAAAQGTTPANAWAGSTLIDMSNLPSTYDPGVLPGETNGSCTSNCGSNGSSGSTTTTVSVKWARYL